MSGPDPLDWRLVRGWLSETEGRALIRLARGARVLELGSYQGRSTIAMASVATLVVSVDHHRGDVGTGPADTYGAFLENLKRAGASGRVLPLCGPIEQVVPALPLGWFDLCFVDSAHDPDSVRRDTLFARRCVRPGGVVAWHDWYMDSVKAGAEAGWPGLEPERTAGFLAWKTR